MTPNREAREIWNRKAAFWDERFGDEGNTFHRAVVAPATERLLAVRPGERVLDVACGNGVLARRLAQLGAEVVAIDFSEEFLNRARARSGEHGDRIDYRLIDATDEAQLLTLGEKSFDAAVCTMALMGMERIEPLLTALGRLLKAGGRFVFAVAHPCFNTTSAALVIERDELDGALRTVYSVKVSRYIEPHTEKGVGIQGEPLPHLYFHRPISLLLEPCFRAGFVLDALEEPVFTGEPPEPPTLSRQNFKQIPPVLVARLRLPASKAGAEVALSD